MFPDIVDGWELMESWYITDVVTLYVIDFVGSPEMLATFVEFHTPSPSSSLNPKSPHKYLSGHKKQIEINQDFPKQRS